jgi:hypothetical protein
MTTQFVIDLAKKVNEIDPRVSAVADGGTIKGCFRGKGGENYVYMVSSNEFLVNNEGPSVRKAFAKAVEAISQQ